MNVLDAAVLEELSAIVEQVAADAAIKGVVITSGKESFCAGADLNMLESMSRAYTALVKSQGEAAANARFFEESRQTSLLYRRIETCGKPWVAAINGTAVGGGFELTLACHHRVAADSDKTRLGLPEIKVGLFPGAGGTQRVARIMPPADALQFLLKGDQVSASRAKAIKLVDEVVPPGDVVKTAKAWIKASGTAKAPWDIENFKLPGGPVQSKAGMMVFTPANAIYRRETYDNYPAARAIMQVVYEGLQLPMDQALRVESRWFAHILRSPEATAMIRSLFVSMQEINKGARRPAGVPAQKLKTIGVLGAGFMGAGIAYVSALAGLDVVLLDRDPETAEKGKAHSQKLLTDQISRGRATAEERDAVLARIKPTADFVELKDCDLVIEAVFEDRKVKDEAIARAQNVIGEKTIFGSNTSTLPITSLADALKDRSRFIGIHFFSPVDRMNLVEIILGKETGDAALAAAFDYVRAIRKTPIVVNDSRGFYTSRVVGTYLREGHLMLEDGVPPAMIENVARMAGMPVGPLALNDEVAVDLAWKILKATEADLGAQAIDPRQKALLEDLVEKRGRYGRKNGKGFYDYPPERSEAAVARPRGVAEQKARSRLDRHCRAQSAAAGDPGAGIRALHRGGRRCRHARGRCRFDPRLRLCAIYRRHHLLYRRHGSEGVRRLVQPAGEQIRRPLRAVQAVARHGEKGRDLLPPVSAADAHGGCMSRVKVALRSGARRVYGRGPFVPG